MKLIGIILLMFLFSCSSKEKKTDGTEITDQATDVKTEEITLDAIWGEFPKATFPLSVQKLPEFKNQKEISKAFIGKFFLDTAEKNSEYMFRYQLSAYGKIQKMGKMSEDAILNSGKFELGELVKVKIYPHSILQYDKDKILYTITCVYASYPACPSSSGTVIYLVSSKLSGELISMAVFAEDSAGSDPPAYGSTLITCSSNSISEGIMQNVKDISEDGEDDKEEVTIGKRKLTWDNSGKIVTQEMK